jgi:alkanesulfonate monooxygenase SsuD/methylene tetrahydromethanopterin reductase-like flavin-dependent oxidoreductase (luciferase family)
MKSLNIGLVDFGYRSAHLNSLIKLNDVVEYAVVGEELGFDKFWIGEHHMPQATLPWSDPTLLLPILATHTQRISIGAAGSLICIHTPYHIASAYKFLNNVFSRRVELGFANGTPYEAVARHATGTNTTEAKSSFEKKVKETIGLLRNEEELFQKDGIVLPPYKGVLPELWTLGSSERSMQQALELGTHLCVWAKGTFLAEDRDRLQRFRSQFGQQHGRFPQVRLVITGICHLTHKKARDIASLQNEEAIIPYGDVAYFTDLILRYQDFYAIHDFMFFNLIRDPKDRIKGIEKLIRRLKDATPAVTDSSALALPVLQ